MNETDSRVHPAPAVIESIIDDWRAILDYEYQADRYEDEDLDNLSRVFDAIPRLLAERDELVAALEASNDILPFASYAHHDQGDHRGSRAVEMQIKANRALLAKYRQAVTP